MANFILVEVVTTGGDTYARHYAIDLSMHFGFAINDLLDYVDSMGEEPSTVSARFTESDVTS